MRHDPSLGDPLLKVTVHFDQRDDGGLSIWSEDLPGLHLSHSDPSRVIHDVKPVLEGLLTDMLGERVSVEPLVGIREALGKREVEEPQASIGIHEYAATRLNAA
jgi:hypothetical protein